MISKGVKSIFPIKHQDIWDKYKLHIQAFWTPEEVSLHDDLRDLETLNDGEKHFIKHVLASTCFIKCFSPSLSVSRSLKSS